MAYDVKRVEVWTGDIADQPGGLAATLEPLAEAGANFAFVVARRHEQGGKGVVFLGPLSGTKQRNAARAARLREAKNMAALQVIGADKRGAVSHIARLCADAGINLRGVS